MRNLRLPHHATVAAYLGLFVALATGGAYAANTVFSTDIVDGQVKTVDLANAAVATDKLANGAVTSDKVKDDALQGRDVLDNSLKGADIDESTLSGAGGGVGSAEPWQAVAAASTTGDACANANATAVFCSFPETNDINETEWRVWGNYGGAFSPAAFYRDQLGIVHLKGLVSNAHIDPHLDVRDNRIFRLPSAYRPATRRVFASVGSAQRGETEVTQGRIDVQPNGLVTLVQACGEAFDGGFEDCSSTGADITLDGITFRPAG